MWFGILQNCLLFALPLSVKKEASGLPSESKDGVEDAECLKRGKVEIIVQEVED